MIDSIFGENPSIVTPQRFGAKGDGKHDDTVAVRDAVEMAGVSGSVFFPAGYYKTTSPLLPLAAQRWIGSGSTNTKILLDHNGIGISVVQKNGVSISGIGVIPVNTRIGKPTGIRFYLSNLCRLDDVSINYCDTGIHLLRECDWLITTQLLINYGGTYGIRIQSEAGSVGANNSFAFTVIALSSATPGRDTYGIQSDGGVNMFTGGEISLCRYPVEFKGTNNRLLNAYIESTEYGPKIDEGVHYIDSHCAGGIPVISAEAKLVGSSGMDLSHYADFLQQRLSFAGLKSLHLFNEGKGNVLHDLSGNERHMLAENIPTWNADGNWGPSLTFDYGHAKGPSSYPLDAHDWTKPFTIAALTRVDSLSDSPANTPILIEFYQIGKYWRVVMTGGTAQAQNYDGTTFSQYGWGTSSYVAGDGRWVWTVFYVDPVNNTVTSLDPFFGTRTAQALPCSALTGVKEVHLGYSAGSGRYAVGRYAYFGVWDRKLSMSEVYDLVNNKLPPVPTNGKLVPYRAAAAPTTGAWSVGDIVYSTTPASTGFVGWIGIAKGTPGTWKTFGAIT